MAIHPSQDRLTPIMASQLGPKDSVGRLVMDCLGDHRLSQVSRAFRDANRQSMIETARHMSGKHPEDLARIAEAARRELPENSSVASLLQAVDELFVRVFEGRSDRVSSIFHEERIDALRAFARAEKEQRLSALYVYLRSGTRENLIKYSSQIKIARHVEQLERWDDFNRTEPEEISKFFAELHKRQRQEASILGQTAVDCMEESLEDSAKFSISNRRFLDAQSALACRAVNHALDENLRRFWRSISYRIHAPSPADDAPIAEIRAWLNDFANRQFLDAIRSMTYVPLETIPPEIEKLRELETLHITHEYGRGMRGLSNELSRLQALQTLRLESSFEEFPSIIRHLHLREFSIRGTFHELPDWLEEHVPDLEHLSVHAPVRILPDAIWRRFYQDPSIKNLCLRFLEGYARRDSDARRMRLGIRQESLTDIPFSLWFKENFYVPYLPLVDLTARELIPLENRLNALWWDAKDSWFTLIPFGLFIGAPAVILGTLGFILLTLPNLPGFLANLLLIYAIEPALTAIRDLLGYSRMVHVRDP